MTPEGVQQIFAEKPHVDRAFMANVPGIMDENAFWKRFFKNELNRQVSLATMIDADCLTLLMMLLLLISMLCLICVMLGTVIGAFKH